MLKNANQVRTVANFSRIKMQLFKRDYNLETKNNDPLYDNITRFNSKVANIAPS